MEFIIEKLDNLSIKITNTKDLSSILDDYFYENSGDEKFNKYQSLATLLEEKLSELNKDLETIFKLIHEVQDEVK